MTDSRIEMIKFVLAFIALILVMLGIYTYSNQDAKKTVPTSPSVTQEVEETEEVSPQIQEVKAKKSSAKNITVKSPKVVSHEVNQEVVNEEDIGKGLTLESIENMDLNKEEKELLMADMVYYQSKFNKPSKVLTFEEGLKLIADDVKNGIIE